MNRLLKVALLLSLLLLLTGAATDVINIPATLRFFQNDGAKVNRLNDRVLVGNATVNDGSGTWPNSDWLAQLGGDTTFAQLASLYDSFAPQASQALPQIAILAGVQSLFAPTGATPRALEFSGINNPVIPGNKPSVWGMYGEAHHYGGQWTAGFELDAIAHVPVGSGWTPYSLPGEPLIGQELACGGGWASSFNCTVALSIASNPRQFSSGLLFMSNSVAADANGRIGAILLPSYYQVQWYREDGQLGATVSGDTSGNLDINTHGGHLRVNGRQVWCGHGATDPC